ncbi:hypothetical protein [Anabaena azotica]|uniref:hypothetical protein n=1 Tax=Anabaena azotica TaxID=197653 RepID=UPI0039A4EDA0
MPCLHRTLRSHLKITLLVECNVRELVTGDYVVRYLRFNNVIFILRIWHGKEFRDFA